MGNISQIALIAPCFNAEKHIARFLDSVLAQSYKDICFILVNDGSTDGTETIIESYKAKLEEQLSEFVYLKKKNNGAASAVNLALKYIDNEYLAWADVDDVLAPDNILQKKEYLDNNRGIGLVLCGARAVDDSTNEIIRPLMIKPEERESNIFESLIFRGIPCYSGVFMIRSRLLLQRLRDNTIYWEPEVGQNWQLLLPVAYDSVCGYIDECLYDVYIRRDSHSHNTHYEREIKRTYAQERVLKNTLYFLPEDQKRDLFDRIEIKYIIRRIELSINHRNFSKYKIYYNDLIARKIVCGFKRRLKYMCMCNGIFRFMYFQLVKAKTYIKR